MLPTSFGSIFSGFPFDVCVMLVAMSSSCGRFPMMASLTHPPDEEGLAPCVLYRSCDLL